MPTQGPSLQATGAQLTPKCGAEFGAELGEELDNIEVTGPGSLGFPEHRVCWWLINALEGSGHRRCQAHVQMTRWLLDYLLRCYEAPTFITFLLGAKTKSKSSQPGKSPQSATGWEERNPIQLVNQEALKAANGAPTLAFQGSVDPSDQWIFKGL